jgi:hypothetical protein
MDGIENLVVREIPDEIKKELEICCALLDDLVNVGSNILDCDDSGNDWIDTNPPVMLLRNYFELVDAISILIKNSSPDPSRVLLRSLTENYLSLSYILKENIREKCKAFIVADMLDQLIIIDRMIYNENNGITPKKVVSVNGKQYTFSEIKNERISLLNNEHFKDTYLQFIKLKKVRKNKDIYPKWYSLQNGPSSIYTLAVSLGETDMYDILYSKLSADTHVANVISGKISSDESGNAAVHQIRSWKNTHLVTTYTISLTLKMYKNYIEKRSTKFASQYNKWVIEFLEKKKILDSLIHVKQ